MMASAADRSRWWTGSGSVWTGATTIESPVWTPSGSTFSIEQTAMQVSSASRITSYSISCQPTRQRSTMTWLDGARAQAGCACVPGRRVSVSTIPPPVPPSVNAGRMTAGRPISASAARAAAWRTSSVAPSTMNDGGVRLADPVEQVAEALAVLGHLDGLERRAEESQVVALEHARPGQVHGEVERGLAAETREQAVRPLPRDNGLHRFDREGLEVDGVRHAGVGHDRGRVAVEQDRPDALVAQRTTGLGAGVVELGGLADDHRPRTEDEDARGPVGRSWRRAPGIGRTGPPNGPGRGGTAPVMTPALLRRQKPVEHLERIERTRGAFGVVLDGLDRQAVVAQPFDGAVVEVALADPEPALGRKRIAHHRHLVVLGRHLDAAGAEVVDRVVRAVVAEAQPPCVGAGSPRHDLVAKADAQERPAVLDGGAGQRHLERRGGRDRPGRARARGRRCPARAPGRPWRCGAGRGRGRRDAAGCGRCST